MIYAVVVIHIIQLPIVQEARLGATMAKVAMAVIHVAEA
jgi:hypothetical protein